MAPLVIDEAAQIMAEATDGFVQPAYGVEGLQALVAAGWTITTPRSSSPSGRELLLELGPLLKPAREIRFRSSDDFDDVSDHELENAARSLRALSYSCHEGARRLEAIRWARRMASGR